ncbi:hypothetical protein L7F22_041346 [Adiantum nelumboides]|nr:hypothetical protein [Adiantum nelumboides]
MASSPSSMSGRRNRPGCMSAIAHLFDFNQALAGRKLLSDKKYGAGLEPLLNTSHDNVDLFKSKASSKGQIEFGKSASVSRRSVEVPMKALIAEEISHELARMEEPKSRAPSVVARLMGLDALPSDRNEQSIQSGDFENLVCKVQSDRLQHGKSPAQMSSRSFRSAGPPTRSASDLSSSRRSAWEEHATNFECSSQSHLHEQDIKKVYDPWKDWKSESHERMQALDDLDVQLAAKQMLIKKKLSEAKLGLLSKHSGPQEKLYESKEFMDAIDFLQANKDFFARFLEEPDSLFAKHLRNGEEKPSRGKVEELGRRPKSYSIGASDNGVRKEPPGLPKSPLRGLERNRQVDERLPEVGPFRQELYGKAQHKHMKSAKHTVSDLEECQQAPTRIVVLKPGPGKVRNLMSLSQNSPRSPREFFDAMEVVKENSTDALRDLKYKLQQEDSRGDLRRTWASASEHSKTVRDPREIAREIARQVRENVLKDMRVSFKKGTISEFGMDIKMDSKDVVDHHVVGVVNASSKGSSIMLARDPASETLSSLSSQVLDEKSLQGLKGDPRRSLEQTFFRKAVTQSTNLHRAPLRRTHNRHRDRGRPHRQRGPRVHGVDVINANQDHSALETDLECDTDSCTYSVCESEADVYTRSDNAACITLLRSRSVPTSCSSFHEGVEEVDEGVVRHDISVAGEAKVVDVSMSFDAAVHQSGSLRRSVFRRKHFGSKGSLSKGKRVAKDSEELFIAKQGLDVQKFDLNVCSEHEKVQHQIDDSGPVLDSDSSASSLDDFLTLEAALIAEGIDGAKVPEGEPSQWTTGKLLSRNALSPTESPSQSLSLPDVEHISADFEISKDLPEQPSPVSVLDASFHEEPASPMDFREISSGLKDLRGRLQHLKFVDQEAVSIQEEYQEEECEFTDDTQSTINHIHSVVSDFEDVDLVVDGILCPQGRMPELIYVKNLLVASGFTIDSATVLTCWHSPSQPLAACIFERVENSYISKKSITIAREKGGLSIQTRRLLFDCVNEVLLEVLGPHVSCRTWWKCRANSSNMPLGTDLVGQVWSGICKGLRTHSEGQDTLGNLVAEDLATKDRWQDFSLDLEIVMLGVEKAIWNDLLEEILSRY